MALTLDQKKQIVSDLRDNLKKQQGIMLVDFSTLSASELAELRDNLRQEDCLMVVAKKSLISRALSEEKVVSDFSIEGASGLVFGFQDMIQPAKIIYQFSKKHDGLKILGGIWDNQVKEKEMVLTLAQLPSQQELLAKFVWTLKAPISGFVGTLKGTVRGLTIVLSEIQKQKIN
jgi:large subunit ribosomal protein L10